LRVRLALRRVLHEWRKSGERTRQSIKAKVQVWFTWPDRAEPRLRAAAPAGPVGGAAAFPSQWVPAAPPAAPPPLLLQLCAKRARIQGVQSGRPRTDRTARGFRCVPRCGAAGADPRTALSRGADAAQLRGAPRWRQSRRHNRWKPCGHLVLKQIIPSIYRCEI